MRRTLDQLKQCSWSSVQDAVNAFADAGLPMRGPGYGVTEVKAGVWQVVDMEGEPPPVQAPPKRVAKPGPKEAAVRSQREQAAGPTVKPGPKPGRETARPGPVNLTDGQTVARRTLRPPPISDKAPPKKAAPPKAAAKKAAAEPKAKPASMASVSADFDAWALAGLRQPEGLKRTEVTAKAGRQQPWLPYLKELGARHGLVVTLKREGRLVRFVAKAKP